METIHQHIREFGEFIFSKGYDTAVRVEPGLNYGEDLCVGKVPDALTEFFADPSNADAIRGVNLTLHTYINFDPVDWDRLDRGGDVDIDWKPVRFAIQYNEQHGFTVSKFTVSPGTAFGKAIELNIPGDDSLPSAKQAWDMLYPPTKQTLHEPPKVRRKPRFKL